MKLLVLILRNFLLLRKLKPRKNYLYFRKLNFLVFQERYIQNPDITELYYISGNEAFCSLIFQEATFRAQKIKRTHSEKSSYISRNGTFSSKLKKIFMFQERTCNI